MVCRPLAPRLDAVRSRSGAMRHGRAAMTSALIAYLAAVAALQVLRTTTGHPRPAALAVSPAELWRGEAWRLVTSALPISRLAAPEFVGMVVAVVLAVRAFGLRVFWIAAALG